MATVGLHAYEPPDGRPTAVSVVLWPRHILVSGDETDTVDAIVIVIESLAEQPVTLSVTVT
jgi:hypothetical protein